MKLTAKINPKNLFTSKKRNTLSRSQTSSFDSSVTTSSDSPESSHRSKSISNGAATPTSVLPENSRELSFDNSNKTSTVSRSQSSSFDLSNTTSSDSPESSNHHKSDSNSVLPEDSREISSDNSKNLFVSNKSITVSRSETSITTSFDSPESSNHHKSDPKSKSNGSCEISSDNSNNLFRSETSSFDSQITTSSDLPESSNRHKSDSKSNGSTTPTSVLPTQSHEISSDDLQYELTQAFRLIDTDNDGKITRSELESLLLRIGVTQSELTIMINDIDLDGDGTISLEEFGVISSAFGPPSCDDEIRGAFEFFDADNDGMITAGELLAVFQAIGDGRCTLEDCKRMINSVDVNGDGVVCFEDFARMMETQV
ncbi:putative EF-hand domain pair protein CML [Helianthus annuus]|uniref:EF-hand domain pair protein CML n=1 Tax=Helianthus annuus TaxID=4232 RepID=A0A251SQ50_HELAN|nr:probable calcium-binding protein CML36 [Helianthus annuus]KAF5772121.1 putative EF-hand domain pair protein CML [Helianthus annuus]KAJ0496580.1 putative EF-hand domain-containing protein [Helianthus annuus]